MFYMYLTSNGDLALRRRVETKNITTILLPIKIKSLFKIIIIANPIL